MKFTELYKDMFTSDLDCLAWILGRDRDGYGLVKIKGKSLRVHRVVWEEANGPIPTGMIILHTCDYPPCARLEHLSLGTYADNTKDMWAKGRGRPRPGVLHHNAKLSEESVSKVRKEWKEFQSVSSRFERKQYVLDKASDLNISPMHLYRVLRGGRWASI